MPAIRLRQRAGKLFRTNPRDILTALGPAGLLLIAALVVAYLYIDPAPPRRLVISAGSEDSAYLDYARRYQQILARDGITLDIRPSEGALDNLRQLREHPDEIDIAFLQDGLNAGADNELLALGNIAYEPLWVFTRRGLPAQRLADLKGRRIAIGRPGAGTEVFARRLLQANGIQARNSTLLTNGRDEAARLLRRGRIDAAFFLGPPDSPLLADLLRSPQVQPMSFTQAPAYTLKFPFLHHLVLPQGSLDLGRNLPAHDVHLLAPATTLVAQDNLHPALVALLLKAMSEVHSGQSLLAAKDTFPNPQVDDFALDPDAARYFKSGPPLLQRYLPFWIATFIDRTLIFFLPLFALLIPLSKTVPQIYTWRIKNRLYRWYGELKYVETQLAEARTQADCDAYLAKIDWIEQQVAHLSVPLSFSEYFYVLKEHIDLVRRNVLRAREQALNTETSALSQENP